jgi:antitoxin ParD1/3/4
MATNTMNIALPDPLRAYVEERVADGEFGTPSEYIRSLIREDRERHRERLESQLLEALESRPVEITPEELQEKTITALLRDKLRNA